MTILGDFQNQAVPVVTPKFFKITLQVKPTRIHRHLKRGDIHMERPKRIDDDTMKIRRETLKNTARHHFDLTSAFDPPNDFSRRGGRLIARSGAKARQDLHPMNSERIPPHNRLVDEIEARHKIFEKRVCTTFCHEATSNNQ